MALALAWAAACQPMPQPFQPDKPAGHNPLLALADRAGVVVLDIDGAPARVGEALAEAISAALLERSVPASRNGGNRGSHFLQARVEHRQTGSDWLELRLDWELVDAAGRTVGRHVVTGKARRVAWQAGAPPLLGRLAKASADGVAALLQTPRIATATAGAAARQIHVTTVSGAPGDGDRLLRQAMVGALSRAGLRIAPGPEDAGAVIAGVVRLGAVARGRREVVVRWTVRGRDRAELGALTQRNSVPLETLRRGWKALATAIAGAAVGVVVEVLERHASKNPQSPQGGSSETGAAVFVFGIASQVANAR